MVLEMKRALEDLKKGADGAYRKIYDATYEEVYCKSFLITQEEKQALSLVEDFYAGVLKEIGEALKAEDQNLWFWQQYYKKNPPRISEAFKRSAQRGSGKSTESGTDSGGASAAPSCDAGDGL